MKIILVAGARPNFMKIAPLMDELGRSEKFDPVLVYTGQHYDEKPDADENLITEGKQQDKIFMVGNLMIDSLVNNLKKAGELDVEIVGLNQNLF